MSHQFTTLRHPLEKALEAEHFLARMAASNGLPFQFELNAFLSASRSITLLLQKSQSHVVTFPKWYERQQEEMKRDEAMRFFLELRNISQKQGPVSYIGGAKPDHRWSHRFVGIDGALPEKLVGRDIVNCCADHLVKLARLLLSYYREFPFHACPVRAFTEEGMTVLGYGLEDVEDAIGLPRGYVTCVDIPVREKLRILQREIDPLDIDALRRLAQGDLLSEGAPLEIIASSGHDLTDEIAALMRLKEEKSGNPRNLFVEAITRRIDEIEGKSLKS